MSIQPTTLSRNSSSVKAPDAKPFAVPAPFVRGAKPNLSTGVARADAKDAMMGGAVHRWKGEVFRACEELGLQPGEQRPMTLGGVPMILRRTQSDGAYVLQTLHDSVNAPFNGLHLNGRSEMSYNMEPLVVPTAANREAFLLFRQLADALGLSAGGPNHEVEVGVVGPRVVSRASGPSA